MHQPALSRGIASIRRAIAGRHDLVFLDEIGPLELERGDGFAAARLRGSAYNDELAVEGGRVRSRANHAGGAIGGISTGERIVVRCAIRPPASIARPQRTVTVRGEPVEIAVEGRHDPCIVPRAVPVLEAMVALVLADRLLAQAAIGG